MVRRYFEFVDEITAKGFTVVLCAPYGSGSDHNNQGNAKELYYASPWMEEMLHQVSKERCIPYFSLHCVLTDSTLQETRLEFFDYRLHFLGTKLMRFPRISIAWCFQECLKQLMSQSFQVEL